ncbi:MAG TPA: YicC family protein [Syntrophales bacterium]|nr:YicC family protein [Syntrophales bacterium]HOM06747.1 YicC family protein [Syntrophales bacterium]HOO00069.1 YicC family protein [Syntrophales bacterium]HPC01656.1 YicC family protein [Syntrophales bacterium]HPQ06095.1 YicC family protein [Syntrophales bacterium]
MIASMTGFGRSEEVKNGRKITVEMKSLNHRFLEVSFRLPPALSYLEPEMKKKVSEAFARGRIEVYIRVDSVEGGASGSALALDLSLAKRYRDLLEELKGELGVPGDITLSMIVSFRDIFALRDTEDGSVLWRDVEGVLEGAIGALKEMRLKEGEAIRRDLIPRVTFIEGLLDDVLARAPQVAKDYRRNLLERVRELSEGMELDEGRLCQEVALMAEKSDITEEVVRLRSHISQFLDLLTNADGEAVGRKIDFLLQEMNREINTMGSKSPDAVIARRVIDMKGELARIREQVQNVE